MKLRKTILLIVALVLAATLFAGCSRPETIAVVTAKDGSMTDTIPFDNYHFWAYYNYAYYDAYYNYYSYYFKTTFRETLDDIYDEDAENPITVNQYLTDSLVNDLKQQYVMLKLFDKYELPFGAEEITDVANYYSSMVSNYGETTVKKIRARLGMSEAEFKEHLRILVKIAVLQQYLFDEGGPMEVTAEQSKQYLLDNYVSVMHIYLNDSYTVEENGETVNKTYTEEELRAKAEEIVDEYNANPSEANFRALVEKYSKDPGSLVTKTENEETVNDYDTVNVTYSNGFLYAVKFGGYSFDVGNNSFVPQFTDLSKSLAVGKVGISESYTNGNNQKGLHIIYKQDFSSNEDVINALLEKADEDGHAYVGTVVEGKLFDDLINSEIDKYDFAFDEKLLEQYSMKNLKSI